MNKTLELKTVQATKKVINIKNVIAGFVLANTFKFKNLNNFLICCIKSCFPMIAESKEFLQLDCSRLLKILSSSGLNVHSEIEVFSAADSWISFDFPSRKKFAKRILSTIRLSLLPISALRSPSSFKKTEKCTELISKFLKDLKNYNNERPIGYGSTRFFSQTDCTVVMIDSLFKGEISVTQAHAYSLENSSKTFNVTGYSLNCCERAVYLNGGIYFAETVLYKPIKGENNSTYIQKYSLSTKTFSQPIKVGYY